MEPQANFAQGQYANPTTGPNNFRSAGMQSAGIASLDTVIGRMQAQQEELVNQTLILRNALDRYLGEDTPPTQPPPGRISQTNPPIQGKFLDLLSQQDSILQALRIQTDRLNSIL